MRAREKLCAHCGSLFSKKAQYSLAQWGAAKFCSHKCTGSARSARLSKIRPPFLEKFNSLFDRTSGCWEWKGTIEGYGYGVMDYAGTQYRAHVLALKFDGRAVPKGMVARHHCDNPRCVRPDHLCVGTVQDNANDAVSRGRTLKGENHNCAKLTNEQVSAIRVAKGSFTKIARDFGISRPTATRIIKRELWRHLP